MPKIKLKVLIKSNDNNTEFETMAILQENLIKYKETDETTVVFDCNNLILTRENNELRMEYRFNEERPTTGKILVKDLNKELEIEIKTKKIERKGNDVKIQFIVENNEFLYHIEEIK